MFTISHEFFPVVQNGINSAQKVPNSAYFVETFFSEIRPKFCEIQAKANFCVIWACISSSSSFDIGREGSESEDYR